MRLDTIFVYSLQLSIFILVVFLYYNVDVNLTLNQPFNYSIFNRPCRYVKNGIVSSNKEKYKALMYKSQTEACRDEFGIVNKDYIDEIQDWNQYIAKNKTMQRDFWFGIFVRNIFDEFQTIDLESIAYKK